jgi:2-polyprenyl-3-methyl-5-hydroxy-6-metoxy-1,4-benzoquinol methylase
MTSTSASDKPVAHVEHTIKQCYSTWGTSYYTDYYGDAAPYPPVHLDLVKRLVDGWGVQRLLDAGCGPASMLRHLTAKDRSAFGFDLTPEMVVEAKRVVAELGLDAGNVWEGSIAERSAFDAPDGKAAYDCVLSCGVMPHIPEELDRRVVENIFLALRPGGHMILEARNELFSMFTLNRYTHEFFLRQLLPIDRMRAARAAGEDLDAALAQVEKMFRTDLPPIRKGKQDEPGYDQVLSRTHNPLRLQEQVRSAGFADVDLHYYHFHCLPPMVASHAPQLFRTVSVQMEENSQDWRGLFMASAFFVVARKPD